MKSKLTNIREKYNHQEKKVERGYDLYTNVNDDETRESHRKKHEKDVETLKNIRQNLKQVENDYNLYQDKVDRLEEYEKSLVGATFSDKVDKTFKMKETLRIFLHNLPFEERKRVVESVVSPETGGKFTVRYERESDSNWFYENMEKGITAKTLKGIKNKIMPDLNIMIDPEGFNHLDITRIQNLIEGLDRGDLLNKVNRKE